MTYLLLYIISCIISYCIEKWIAIRRFPYAGWKSYDEVFVLIFCLISFVGLILYILILWIFFGLKDKDVYKDTITDADDQHADSGIHGEW